MTLDESVLEGWADDVRWARENCTGGVFIALMRVERELRAHASEMLCAKLQQSIDEAKSATQPTGPEWTPSPEEETP